MYILNLVNVGKELKLIFLLRNKLVPIFKGDIIPNNLLYTGRFTLLFFL